MYRWLGVLCMVLLAPVAVFGQADSLIITDADMIVVEEHGEPARAH